MSIQRRLAYNTVIQVLGKAVGVLISLATVRLITRNMGVNGYGEYTGVIAYCSLYAVFADLGVNLNLIKELSRGDAVEKEVIGTAVSLRFVSSLVVLITAFIISLLLPYSEVAHQGIAIILLAIFAQTTNSLFVSILQAKLQMQYATATELVGRGVIFLLSVYSFSKGYGLSGVFWAVTIGNTVNLTASYIFTLRFATITAHWSAAGWREVLVRSLPVSATAILSLIYFKVDSVILSNIHLIGRSNIHEVGIYGTAYKVLEILLVLPAIFMGNIFPIISNFIAKKDERLPSLLQRSFDIMFMVGAYVTVLVFALAPQIVNFIADVRFASAAVPLRILSFAVFTSYFSGIFTYSVLALNEQRKLVTVYIVATIFNIGTNLLFIPRYSYIAASWTTFLTEIVVLAGSYMICRSRLQIKISLAKSAHIALILLIVSIFLRATHALPFIAVGISATILYGALLLSTRAVKISELIQLAGRA